MADSMMALIPVASSADLEREAELRNSELQAQPMIQGLAAHVRRRWEVSRDAKRELEERMLECLRQRNGDYDPDIEAQINAQGGSDILFRLLRSSVERQQVGFVIHCWEAATIRLGRLSLRRNPSYRSLFSTSFRVSWRCKCNST